jgi:membrane fusion protein (multidrug efflux system)
MAEATAEGTPGAEADREPKPPLPQVWKRAVERFRAWAAKHRRTLPFLILGAAVFLVAATALLIYLDSFVSTDDAQVDGNISAIGARVSGTVTAVHVENNTHVQAGDPLVELDPADYQVAVALAEANLDQALSQHEGEVPAVPITTVATRTTIATAEKDVAGAQADLAAAERDRDAAVARLKEAEANNRIAQVEVGRSRHLVETGAVPQQDLDERQATADARAAGVRAARANVESSRKHADEARAKVAEAEARFGQAQQTAPEQLTQTAAGVKAREAAVRAAQAALDQARLNLGYTHIATPIAGVVGEKSVNIGDRLQPAQELLAVVQVEDLWITANYKETQLRHVHPGQRATVRVDALGRTFHGHVESLPGATGARFSLLPPENATGNYVKVVQRLPVRIRLDPGQVDLDRLRPGMSVEPRVWMR